MALSEESRVYTAAILVIGNEILSGRTLDKNTQWIAERLVMRGIRMREVRIIPDDEAVIVKTVNELRAQVDYVFTTGGIGPTHDDITAGCIAKAFGVAFSRNEEAYNILLAHYGPADLTEARARMAMIPEGARLIPNPVSAAPGFIMGNVYVMAGVPRIMQAMLDHVLTSLKGGTVMLMNTVTCGLPESVLAKPLGELQSENRDVEIGSYPHFKMGSLGVSVVIRGTDETVIKAVTREFLRILSDFGETPQSTEYQVALD